MKKQNTGRNITAMVSGKACGPNQVVSAPLAPTPKLTPHRHKPDCCVVPAVFVHLNILFYILGACALCRRPPGVGGRLADGCMHACRHAGMQACMHAGMQACWHAGMKEFCIFVSLYTCTNVCL